MSAMWLCRACAKYQPSGWNPFMLCAHCASLDVHREREPRDDDEETPT